MMNRIYVYIHDLRSSGVVRDALILARSFAEDHPTTLVAGYGSGFLREEAGQGSFDLVVLADRPGRLARYAAAARLRTWLARQAPGVLISMGAYGHPTVFLAVQRLRHIRRIYRMSNEIAGPVKGEGTLRRLWLALLLRDSARMILVGSAMARHDMLAPAVTTGRAVSIASGVDRPEALERATAPCPHPWLDGTVPVVIAIGRLRPQKNLELLIDAVTMVRLRRRVRLVIVGNGTQAARDRLVQAAKGFSADFLLAGETDNVFAWLARSQVFALPSRWEGSSVALLEALAVGTPVVASRLAGDAADVLGEGRYGLLFDGTSAADLADALSRQLSPARILPQDRADDYALARIIAAYRDVVGQVLCPGNQVTPP